VANIALKDEDGRVLAEAPLGERGLGRYVRSLVALRSLNSIRSALDEPLSDAAGAARQIDFTLERGVTVGQAGELTLEAGGTAAIGVHGAGSALFAESALQADVTVPHGTTYTSLRLEARLGAGLASGGAPFSFGFEAGTGLGYAFYHPFDTAAAGPQTKTLGAALKQTITGAGLAADVDDLNALPVGAFVSLTGSGRLSLRGTAVLSSSVNALATPSLPLLGSVTVPVSANVSVDAAWEASGDFELRVGKPSAGRIALSYHKSRGRAFTIGARATAGIAANFRDSDLLQSLMRAISTDPEADILQLVDAGLSDAQISAIQRAIAASIDRSLTISAQMQMSSVRQDEALFSYDLDLDGLSEPAKGAVRSALDGDLTALEDLTDVAGSGVRASLVGTIRLRQRKSMWRLNLLGILNSASLKEQISTGVMTFDPVSGALNITDQIAANRIRVDARPLESHPDKLRRLLFESLVVTAAYRASQAVPSQVALTAEHTYLEQHGRTNRATLLDHYRAILALGLRDIGERNARLGMEQEFGASTFSLHCRFDNAACDALFLDQAGAPYPRQRYERIARQAFLALLPADDPIRNYRRFALESDDRWKLATDNFPDVGAVLPAHVHNIPGGIDRVRGDVFTILWWARAMSKAGPALLEVRRFLAGRDAATLVNNRDFQAKRKKLEEALAAVIANSQARFDDPWDVLALDFAASGKDAATAIIVSTKVAAIYDDTTLPVPAAPARETRRAVRARAAAAADTTGPSARDWTEGERAILDRHIVNLRQGKLSASGAFSSTEEQVSAIFTTHIPRAIADRTATAPVRIVFYAHGGLTSETEGLLPVLARDRFWRLNGLYPVYFVWETGLRETIRDLLGVPSRQAAPASIRDAALEEAARPFGRRIWGEMKENAAAAVRANAGGTLVARLSRDLWAAHPDAVEFHAIGHSAGAIFHAHFLPTLIDQRTPAGFPKLSVQSLQLLAPAATTKLFKDRLKPLVGQGKPITSLTIYTMNDRLEQADSTVRPYGKSLLYLVSRSFEDEKPTPILGLEESLKRDAPLIRFFGLAGREKVADIIISQTPATVPLNSRSQSTTHGGFDNDVKTMSSVVRRIRQVPDSTPIVDFFEDPVEGRDRTAVPPVDGLTPPRVGIDVPRITPRARRGRARRAARRGCSSRRVTGEEEMKAVRQPREFVAVTKALNATQRFQMPDFVELGHFCREVSKRSSATAVKAAAQATLATLDGDEGWS
jgi:hypothetical protein